jgi:hypothetical protein
MSDYYTCRNHYRSLDYASIVLFLYIYTAYGVSHRPFFSGAIYRLTGVTCSFCVIWYPPLISPEKFRLRILRRSLSTSTKLI